MKKKFPIFCLVIILIALITVSGCSNLDVVSNAAAENEDVIKIGVLEPLTGVDSKNGLKEKAGIELANKQYPNVLGKKIEVIYIDNKSEAKKAASAAEELINEEHIAVVLGSYGNAASLAAGEVFQKAEIPVIGISCTNPLVTIGNDYYFRVCPIDAYQGTVMARYAYNEADLKKVAVIENASQEYSITLSKAFQEAFIKLTEDESAIVNISSYTSDSQDYESQLLSIKDSGAQAIFAPGHYQDSAEIIKQARALNIDLPFLGGSTWNTPKFIEAGKNAVEGAAFPIFFDPDIPLTEQTTLFLKAYRAQDKEKEIADETLLGFDAYLLALDAIERAGSKKGPKIKEALAKTQNFQGASGVMRLDQNGDPIKSAIIQTVKDKAFTYKATIELLNTEIQKSQKQSDN